MDTIKKLKNNYWIIAITLVFITITYVWFGDGLAKATGEGGLLFLALRGYLVDTFSTWNNDMLGQSTFSLIGALPLYLILLFFSKYLLPGYVEGIFFFVSMFLAGLGIGLLIKKFVPKVNQIILVFIAIAYTFNSYSIPFIWNRFLYNYILAYGLFPLLLYLWIEYLDKGKLNNSIYYFFLCFIFSFAFTAIPFLLIVVIVIGFWSIGLVLEEIKNKKNPITKIKRVLNISVMFILSQFFWIIPFVFGNQPSVNPNYSFFSESGNLMTTVILSKYYGGIENILRMYRSDMWNLAYDKVHWAQWYINRLPNYMSWFPVLLILISLYFVLNKFKNNHHILILILMFIFLGLFVIGVNPPLGKSFLLFYKIHPVLSLLRNPYEKAGPIFYVHFFIIVGIGLSIFINRKKIFKLISFIIISFWLIVELIPVINGLVFTYKYEVSYDPKIGFRVKLPDYYKEANNYLNSKPNLARVVALPIYGEGMTYKWPVGYDGVEASNALFEKPFISINTTSFGLADIVELINKIKPPDILKLVGNLNSDHLLIRQDIELQGKSRLPSQIEEGLAGLAETNFKQFGPLKLYTIPDKYWNPRLYLSDNLVFSSRSDIKNARFLNFDKNYLYIIPSDNIKPHYRILTPEFGTEEIDYNPPSNEENIFKELPYVSHPPYSPLYPLVRIKESIWKLINSYDLERILRTLAGKRLNEIVLLVKQNRTDLLNQAILDYKSSVSPFILQAKLDILKGGRVEYWWKLFWYHEVALNKLIDISSNSVRDNLLDLEKWLSEELIDSGVLAINPSVIEADSNDYLIKRYVVNVDESGRYNLRILSGFEGFTPGNIFQVDSHSINAKYIYDIETSSYNTEIDFQKGIHEIRIPINIKTQYLQKDEIILDKGIEDSDNTSENIKWNITTPIGVGEIELNIEYKILQGQGPTINFRRMPEGLDIQQPSQFMSDGYYFDWKKESLWSIESNWLENLEIEVKAEYYNQCDFGSQFELCKNKDLRVWMEKPTAFAIRNVSLKFIPDMEIALLKKYDGNENLSNSNENHVNFQRITPSLYKVRVEKNTNKKVLVFSEQYHSSWDLVKVNNTNFDEELTFFEDKIKTGEYNSKSNILEIIKLLFTTSLHNSKNDIPQQILVNGYANGWILDEGGSYILIFKPERLLYLGWFVTIISFVVISYSVYKNKFSKKK